ncbi:hypothetical protein RJ639_036455 [Escallonia herrerae]|uniref:BTB domain-containing protein n=1 Tax=Escallonia herrerae TaxID=1293975 RepID=A0AA88WS38_9ASTE|nr:hypothetical protein RJ639_036455 [Escallonia herrerae]
MRPSSLLSSKKQQVAAENDRAISGHILTVHQRLNHALSLGQRFYTDKTKQSFLDIFILIYVCFCANHGYNREAMDCCKALIYQLSQTGVFVSDEGRKWYSADIEIQRLVVRSIDAFLDSISSEALQHPLVKDTVADIVEALKGIFQYNSESVVRLTSNVVLKMVGIIPSSVLQPHFLKMVCPLTCLLSSCESHVAVSCATALGFILSNLCVKREKEVLEILREKNAVGKILHNVHDFPGGSMPVVYLKEMVSLLSRILWRWPSFRFCVSDDTIAMEVLGSTSLEPDSSTKVAILQLYSTIALCSNGANKLLDTGQNLLQMMVQSMGSSNPHSVKMAGFKLAQCFAVIFLVALTILFDRCFVSSRFNYGLSRSAQISEQGCSRLMKMCCEPLINAIISGMSDWSLVSGKLTKQQISLFGEACRLAMITRWAGEQHKHFWKLGVEKVLLQLLLNNNHETFLSQNLASLDQQIAIANKGQSASSLLFLRPYIWDILGWLATNCAEDFDPKKLGNELNINMLITCSCLAFVDSVRTRPTCGTESVCRAVLLMLYSPSKFIASQARSVLCEVLKPHGKEDIKHLLTTLNATSSGDKFTMQDNLQIIIYLMRLVCYLALPRYPKHVVKNHGIKTLLAFIKGWLSSPVHIKRSSLAPHLRTSFHEKTCCYDYAGDWEGEDMLLLYGLWGLAELIRHSDSVKNHAHVFANQMDYTSAQLVSQLEEICTCDDSYAPGSRWFAAYLLSYFGLYGFPSKLGKRIGEALKEKEHTDLKLILRDQEAFTVHGVIVMTRCPPLLPPGKLPPSKKTSSDISEDVKTTEVCLSSHVDHEVLLKVLDFIYSGYLEAGEDLVKKLKVFARHCKLQSMLQILCRKHPKWGSPLPSFNLIFALGSSGKRFWDIILEAEEDHLRQWKCNICCLSVPHIHAHKVILSSSCEYLQALFRSGMRESGSQTIKVTISWKALVRLIKWFYSDELQKPASGCLWDNLDADEKLCELKPYIELCWLAKFWLIGNDLYEDCLRVVMSCLDSAKSLSVKVIQFAAGFSLWELAKVAANHMAPFYHHLRNSGELEELDEELIEMVRVASVRLLQESGHHSS